MLHLFLTIQLSLNIKSLNFTHRTFSAAPSVKKLCAAHTKNCQIRILRVIPLSNSEKVFLWLQGLYVTDLKPADFEGCRGQIAFPPQIIFANVRAEVAWVMND